MMKKKDGTGTESDSLERLSNDRKMTLYSNLKAGSRWVFTRYTNHWHTLPNLLLWEIRQFAESTNCRKFQIRDVLRLLASGQSRHITRLIQTRSETT